MGFKRPAMGANSAFASAISESTSKKVVASGTAFTYGQNGFESDNDLKKRDVIASFRGNADTYILGIAPKDQNGKVSTKYKDLAPWGVSLVDTYEKDKETGEVKVSGQRYVIAGGVDLMMRVSKESEEYRNNPKSAYVHLNNVPRRGHTPETPNTTNSVSGFGANGSDNIVSDAMNKEGAKNSFVTQLYNLVNEDLIKGTNKTNSRFVPERDEDGKLTGNYVAFSREVDPETGRNLMSVMTEKDIKAYEKKVNDLYEARVKGDEKTVAKLEADLLKADRPAIQVYVPLKGDIVLGIDTFDNSSYARYKNDPNHYIDPKDAKEGKGNVSKYTIVNPRTMMLGEAVSDEEIKLQDKFAFISNETRLTNEFPKENESKATSKKDYSKDISEVSAASTEAENEMAGV